MIFVLIYVIMMALELPIKAYYRIKERSIWSAATWDYKMAIAHGREITWDTEATMLETLVEGGQI